MNNESENVNRQEHVIEAISRAQRLAHSGYFVAAADVLKEAELVIQSMRLDVVVEGHP